MNTEVIILSYIAVVSVFAIVATAYDKYASSRSLARIPEKSLFAIAAVGGAAAMYLTMLLIRHKTKHLSFMIGIPAILVFKIFLALWVLRGQGVL